MNNFCDISMDLNEDLKCAICKNLLSYFPIFISIDNRNICGRCTASQESSFLRNTAYEALSKFLKFACRYKNEGCAEELLPKAIPQHERTCPYRTIKCPTASCKWEGKCMELLQHCHEKHLNLIIQNGDLEIDTSNNNENINLLQCGRILLIMKNKFDSSTLTLETAVYQIPDKSIVDQYSCQLTVKNANRSISVEFMTSDFDNIQYIELFLAAIKNHSETFPSQVAGKMKIVNMLENESDNNLKSVMEISQLKCLTCLDCSEFVLPPFHECKEIQGTYCSRCAESHSPQCYTCSYSASQNSSLEEVAYLLKYPCRNKKNGCSMVAKVAEIKSHQEMCLFGETECSLNELYYCIWKGIKRDLKSHLEEIHDDVIKPNGSEISLDLNMDQYITLIKFSNCLFHVIFLKKSVTCFQWNVQTVGCFMENFQCELEILDVNNDNKKMITRVPCCQLIKKDSAYVENNYNIFHVDQIQNFITNNNTIALKINIFKK